MTRLRQYRDWNEMTTRMESLAVGRYQFYWLKEAVRWRTDYSLYQKLLLEVVSKYQLLQGLIQKFRRRYCGVQP